MQELSNQRPLIHEIKCSAVIAHQTQNHVKKTIGSDQLDSQIKMLLSKPNLLINGINYTIRIQLNKPTHLSLIFIIFLKFKKCLINTKHFFKNYNLIILKKFINYNKIKLIKI